MMRWCDYVRWLLWGAFIAFAMGVLLPASLKGQDTTPNALFVNGEANKVMTAGLDTATMEKAFCLWWHETPAGDTIWIDGAMTPTVWAQDALHVTYEHCPWGMATAHWHLLDLQAVNYRTPTDSASLVKFPAPFAVLILRRHFGDRVPLYKYYDR